MVIVDVFTQLFASVPVTVYVVDEELRVATGLEMVVLLNPAAGDHE
jgi:PII-like signaling protein